MNNTSRNGTVLEPHYRTNIQMHNESMVEKSVKFSAVSDMTSCYMIKLPGIDEVRLLSHLSSTSKV